MLPPDPQLLPVIAQFEQQIQDLQATLDALKNVAGIPPTPDNSALPPGLVGHQSPPASLQGLVGQ